MATTADKVEELTQLISQVSALKFPKGGAYAYESGCLTSVLRTLGNNPTNIDSELDAWLIFYKKQLVVLKGLPGTP